jgi:hypothetical protein
MGTHAAYLLDKQGQPLLRLRADAVHTAHLLRDARCSLYVQARRGARRGAPAQLRARAPARARTQPQARLARTRFCGRMHIFLASRSRARARHSRSPSRSRAA